MVNDPSVQYMHSGVGTKKSSRPELSIIMSDNRESMYANTFGQGGFQPNQIMQRIQPAKLSKSKKRKYAS